MCVVSFLVARARPICDPPDELIVQVIILQLEAQ